MDAVNKNELSEEKDVVFIDNPKESSMICNDKENSICKFMSESKRRQSFRKSILKDSPRNTLSKNLNDFKHEKSLDLRSLFDASETNRIVNKNLPKKTIKKNCGEDIDCEKHLQCFDEKKKSEADVVCKQHLYSPSTDSMTSETLSDYRNCTAPNNKGFGRFDYSSLEYSSDGDIFKKKLITVDDFSKSNYDYTISDSSSSNSISEKEPIRKKDKNEKKFITLNTENGEKAGEKLEIKTKKSKKKSIKYKKPKKEFECDYSYPDCCQSCYSNYYNSYYPSCSYCSELFDYYPELYNSCSDFEYCCSGYPCCCLDFPIFCQKPCKDHIKPSKSKPRRSPLSPSPSPSSIAKITKTTQTVSIIPPKIPPCSIKPCIFPKPNYKTKSSQTIPTINEPCIKSSSECSDFYIDVINDCCGNIKKVNVTTQKTKTNNNRNVCNQPDNKSTFMNKTIRRSTDKKDKFTVDFAASLPTQSHSKCDRNSCRLDQKCCANQCASQNFQQTAQNANQFCCNEFTHCSPFCPQPYTLPRCNFDFSCCQQPRNETTMNVTEKKNVSCSCDSTLNVDNSKCKKWKKENCNPKFKPIKQKNSNLELLQREDFDENLFNKSFKNDDNKITEQNKVFRNSKVQNFKDVDNIELDASKKFRKLMSYADKVRKTDPKNSMEKMETAVSRNPNTKATHEKNNQASPLDGWTPEAEHASETSTDETNKISLEGIDMLSNSMSNSRQEPFSSFTPLNNKLLLKKSLTRDVEVTMQMEPNAKNSSQSNKHVCQALHSSQHNKFARSNAYSNKVGALATQGDITYKHFRKKHKHKPTQKINSFAYGKLSKAPSKQHFPAFKPCNENPYNRKKRKLVPSELMKTTIINKNASNQKTSLKNKDSVSSKRIVKKESSGCDVNKILAKYEMKKSRGFRKSKNYSIDTSDSVSTLMKVKNKGPKKVETKICSSDDEFKNYLNKKIKKRPNLVDKHLNSSKRENTCLKQKKSCKKFKRKKDSNSLEKIIEKWKNKASKKTMKLSSDVSCASKISTIKNKTIKTKNAERRNRILENTSNNSPFSKKIRKNLKNNEIQISSKENKIPKQNDNGKSEKCSNKVSFSPQAPKRKNTVKCSKNKEKKSKKVAKKSLKNDTYMKKVKNIETKLTKKLKAYLNTESLERVFTKKFMKKLEAAEQKKNEMKKINKKTPKKIIKKIEKENEGNTKVSLKVKSKMKKIQNDSFMQDFIKALNQDKMPPQKLKFNEQSCKECLGICSALKIKDFNNSSLHDSFHSASFASRQQLSAVNLYEKKLKLRNEIFKVDSLIHRLHKQKS